MIKTVETIEISETTTSYRVHIDNVDVKETLDERYRRKCDSLKVKERGQAPTKAQSEES
jgi:hypothetical protein